MTTEAVLWRPTPRGIEHRAQAHLSMAKSGMVIPVLQDALRETHPDERKLVPMISKVLGAAVGLLGFELRDKQKMELFEYLLKGGFIAGGSQMGDYLESQAMKHVFRNTAIFTPPANVAVHLYTSATSDANSTGTEVSGGSYAAVNVGTTSGWSDPGATGGATDNAADVDFGTASANWGTVSYCSLEVAGGANRLFHGALTASKTVNSGDSFKFATGDLDVSMA